MKRSSCASGSGYVPSYSIGFCVAMTMNGGSSGYVTPSTDTCRSSMHSSSAAWVFGEARFTSSTRRRFANTGPGRNSNSFCRWLKTLTPVTSDGSRSGVNWSREKWQSSERASALASIVLPTPGKSSMIACPSATRQRTIRRNVSSGAWTTRPRFSTIVWISPFGAGSTRAQPLRCHLDQCLHLVEDRRCNLLLRCFRNRPLSGCPEEGHLVVDRVEADVPAGDVVENEEVGALACQLLARALEAGLTGLGGEADEELAVAAPFAQGREHVGRRLELERPGGRVLRALRSERLGRPVVGDCGGHDDHVGFRRARGRLSLEIGCRRRLDELDPGRGRHREICGEQRHLGAAPASLRRERHAHPSRRAVADEADRVKRLARAARRDEHPLPTQRTVPHEQGTRGAQDLVRLGHPPHAELSLRRLALVRPEEDDAAHAQRLGIRAGRGMRPHPRIHRRRDEHRTAMGERSLGEDVVGEPVRELGERVRRAGRDDEQVGARQVEVDVVSRRTPRERPKRLGGDEALGARRDEGNDLVALLDEQPAQLARLVGGDAAGHPQEDAGHARMMPTLELASK